MDFLRIGVANGFHSRSPEWLAAAIAAGPGGSVTSMTVGWGNALQITEESWSVVPEAGLQHPQLEPAPGAASGAARAGMRPKVVHHSSKSAGRMPRYRPPRNPAVRCFIEKSRPRLTNPEQRQAGALVRHYTDAEFQLTEASFQRLCGCSQPDPPNGS